MPGSPTRAMKRCAFDAIHDGAVVAGRDARRSSMTLPLPFDGIVDAPSHPVRTVRACQRLGWLASAGVDGVYQATEAARAAHDRATGCWT